MTSESSAIYLFIDTTLLAEARQPLKVGMANPYKNALKMIILTISALHVK